GMTDLIDKMKKGRKEEQDYTDYIKSLGRIEAQANALNNLIGRLPAGQQEAANRVLTKIQEGQPGTDKEGRLRKLTNVVFQQAQGGAEARAAAAEGDIADLDAVATTAKQATAAAGMALVSTAAVGLGLATAAQVGALTLGSGMLQGAKAGHAQGGVPGALWGTARAAVPGLDTVEALVDVAKGRGSLLGVGLAVVQDLGKAATLATLGARNVGPATSTVPRPSTPGAAARPAGTVGPMGTAGPTAPGPLQQGASRIAGKEAITNPQDYLKDVNPYRSHQGRGFTKGATVYPDNYWDFKAKRIRPHPYAGETIPATQDIPGGSRTAINTWMNCPNTTIAVDAKLAGRPPLPPAPPSTGMSAGEMQAIYGRKFTPAASRTTIESHLKAAGPGSRGVVAVLFQAKRPPGGGPPTQTAHVFNAVNDGGKIKFLDGQTGQPGSFSRVVGIAFMRTD
ncbi:toxin glutamine deamidase domain-containing protein, partial [Kitasatospora sp. NPDC054939]